MKWTTLQAKQLPALLRFLGPREAQCTAFTEKLVGQRETELPDPRHYRVAVRAGRNGEVDGAVLQSRSGLYYPVLSESRPVVEPPAVTLLRRATRRVYSVMGKSSDVHAFETALDRAPSQSVEYHLMCQQEPPQEIPLPRLPSDLEIRRSTVRDARSLAGLQKQYEIEEVLLPGNVFDANSSLNHLREALRTQLVLHGVSGGKTIAKAGTNARGLFFDQIGGVFTVPELRSRGIGTALMLRLISIIAAEKKSATLFVKLHNLPAITMYRNLGFRVLDGFRISYYR